MKKQEWSEFALWTPMICQMGISMSENPNDWDIEEYSAALKQLWAVKLGYAERPGMP